jgi:hypothetical protein
VCGPSGQICPKQLESLSKVNIVSGL